MELVDARLRRVLRGCGLAMVVGAALPWLVNLSAGSALADLPPAATDHPLLAGHWTGVSDTSSGVSTGSCDFTAITRTHSGIGWHFVLPGIPANLSSFSATFADAGTITVTTTETAAGVVVQRGKGAVIFTPGHDTLVATGIWHDANGDHAGQGVNNRPNGHYMQLSNVCGGTPTSAGSPPPPTGAPTPTTGPTPTHAPRPTVTPSVGPTGSGTPGPTGTPTGTPSPTGSPTPTGSTTPTGTPSATPSSTGSPTPTTSVVPTQTVSPTPTTSVLHTKIISPTPSPAPRRVPFTGFPARIGFALSLGLVGVGALLLLAPGRVIAAAVGRHHRR